MLDEAVKQFLEIALTLAKKELQRLRLDNVYRASLLGILFSW